MYINFACLIASFALIGSLAAKHRKGHSSSGSCDSGLSSSAGSSDTESGSYEPRRTKVTFNPTYRSTIHDARRTNVDTGKLASTRRQYTREDNTDLVIDDDDFNSAGSYRLSSRREIYNGKPMSHHPERMVIEDALNVGWLRFRFGPQGTESNYHIQVNARRHFRIRIVDLYCPGDEFEILSRQGRKSTLVGATDTVQADHCLSTSADPQHAWSGGSWSRGEFIIKPGSYIFSIRVRSSPYGGGTGAIRFDEVELNSTDWDVGINQSSLTASSGKVCAGYEGLIVINGNYSGQSIQSVCSGHGWTGAQLTSCGRKLMAALKSINVCLGEGSTVWIAGYNGNSHHYLAATSRPKNRLAINVYDDDTTYPVLCQKETY